MTIKEEYKFLIKKKIKLENNIKNMKYLLKVNYREFDNIKYIELDLSRGIKCRKGLNHRSL